MEIRKILKPAMAEAMDLVWLVFQEFEAPEYSAEGIRTFKDFLDIQCIQPTLEIFGAYEEDRLLGVIATRNNRSHIALFFVRKEQQGQGIGRCLFEYLLSLVKQTEITVNSSPYAAKIYRKLGFQDLDCEQVTDGLRYIPMKYINA